jgi:HAD superfamily hydrolase (TIGR01549 family)
MAGRLRLITFDLDDTLWDLRPVLVQAEQDLATWAAGRCPELVERFDRTALMALRLELMASRPELAHRISDVRIESLRLALEQCGRAPAEALTLAREGFEIFIAARHAVQPFDGVEECLKELQARYTLGVITNGNADVFRLPLGRYFDFAVRAETLAAAKPDPIPFSEALRTAGVEAAETLHVGDHHDHDIAGAIGAGMRSAWYNPRAKAWPGGPQADGEFRDFAELPGLLSRLQD